MKICVRKNPKCSFTNSLGKTQILQVKCMKSKPGTLHRKTRIQDRQKPHADQMPEERPKKGIRYSGYSRGYVAISVLTHTVACKRVGVFRNFRIQAKKSKNNFIKR